MDKLLKIGHTTNHVNGTGATVFLFNQPVEAAYHLCGSSPATRELTVLELDAHVSHIDSLVFLGGSAIGLGAVDGAIRWLEEHNRGWLTPHGKVPIVPAAAIYDLAYKKAIPPTAAEVYQACLDATAQNEAFGRIGAGTGATIGKLVPDATRMTGGLGRAAIHLDTGLKVVAYAIVNSVGDVRDEVGNIIAGAQWADGQFANCENYLLSGQSERTVAPLNTTLIAILTNARFSKNQLKRIAKMASAGLARAIAPIFTPYDGDLVYCISLGEQLVSETIVGTISAEVTRQAIVNAVLTAEKVI